MSHRPLTVKQPVYTKQELKCRFIKNFRNYNKNRYNIKAKITVILRIRSETFSDNLSDSKIELLVSKVDKHFSFRKLLLTRNTGVIDHFVLSQMMVFI